MIRFPLFRCRMPGSNLWMAVALFLLLFATVDGRRVAVRAEVSSEDMEKAGEALDNLSPEQKAKAKKALDAFLGKGKGSSGSSEGSSDSSSGSTSEGASDGSSAGSSQGSESQTSGSSGTSSPAESTDLSGASGEAPGPKAIDPNDKMYCEAHMKNANRHFKKQDFEKAKAELDLIFERVPDFAVARFMRAVIAAKTKDYLAAWQNIERARAQDPDNPKIKGFIEKLETVSPKPAVLPEQSAGKQRPTATFAAMQWVDALETLCGDKVGGKVVRFQGQEPREADGTVVWPVTLIGNEALDQKGIETRLTEAGGSPGSAQVGSGGKELQISLGAGSLPRKNPEVKPVDKLGTFLNEVGNECDVQIKNSEEGEADAEKVVLGSYSVVARSWTQINDFLRKIAPHAVEYWVAGLESATVNQQAVWKGDLKIRFKTE